MLVCEPDTFLAAEFAIDCLPVPLSLRRPHIVDKAMMVSPWASPLKSAHDGLLDAP